MHLDDVALFLRVVALGTLSAAARERDVPTSQVTRSLARLEAQLGVRLLHRSTHGLSLTDEGDSFAAHAQQLLASQASWEAEFAQRRSGPVGWVRLAASPVIAQAVLVPALPALQRAHPGVQIDLAADDRIVDLVREGIDVAIRTGPVSTESLVARRIGTLTRGLYAAPAYAERRGLPRSPDELGAHQLIANSANPALNLWPLVPVPVSMQVSVPESEAGDGEAAASAPGRPGKAGAPKPPAPRVHEVRGHIRTDNTGVVLAMACAGLGIARLVSRVAEPLVRSGQLLPVLPGWRGHEALPVHAVMVRDRQRLPKVRAVVDHLADHFADQGADHAADRSAA